MNKKIPERKCLGCDARRPKNELIRIVRLPDGHVVADKTGKLSGRGAYLCPSLSCFVKARKKKRLESSLGADVPAAIYDDLEKTLAEETEGAT